MHGKISKCVILVEKFMFYSSACSLLGKPLSFTVLWLSFGTHGKLSRPGHNFLKLIYFLEFLTDLACDRSVGTISF